MKVLLAEQAKHVLQRGHLCAHHISRLLRPLRAPGAAVVARLCKAVLLRTVLYGIALWRPSEQFYHELTTIICRPLRRVLSLPRGTSMVDLLAEFGILRPMS